MTYNQHARLISYINSQVCTYYIQMLITTIWQVCTYTTYVYCDKQVSIVSHTR